MIKPRYITLFLGIFLLMVPAGAYAEVSIGIVDVQRLLTESDAAKNIHQQMQKSRDSFIEELSQQEQGLRQREKDLAKEHASLKPEEFAQKKQDFEKRFIETQQMAKAKKSSLDKAFVQAMSELKSKVFNIVESIAEEQGYDLVISRQNVVLGHKSIDISEEAMNRLNKSISEIPLKIESN